MACIYKRRVNGGKSMKHSQFIFSIFLGFVSFVIVISFILQPDQIFTASLRGLKIWWDIVFPALLPFVIVSELMMGVGLAHFLGVLLEPIMRPLFNVPGSGAFALTMGFASGYPVGAKLTVRLREQNMVTRSEGERLVSFASSSDPLFMFGAVAVGFFHDVSLGILLATVHYLSSIIIGVMMRFHDRKGETTYYKPEGRSILRRALKAMHDARLQDGRTIGKLMGDSVSSAIQTLLLVGGLIIIFSVLMTIFTFIHVTTLLSHLFALILFIFGLPVELNSALINGLFEVTLGAQGASLVGTSTELVDRVAIASAILAWGGLSVHAQIASILSTTDIRYRPYLYARIIHTFIAALLTFVVWEYLAQSSMALPTFLYQIPNPYSWQMWGGVIFFLFRTLLLIGFLILLSIILSLLKKIVRMIFPKRA